MAKKNEVAVAVDNTAIMTEVPDYLKGKEGTRGNENVTMQDIVIPRLEVIQGLSPAVKRGDPGFIEGAQQGMLVNSVSQQLYGDDAMVIPVFFKVQHLVWKRRKDKAGKSLEGGFFGAFDTLEEAQQRCAEEGGEEADIEVIDTPQHLCLIVNAGSGETEEIMLSMPRTKAKISRKWNSLIRLLGGDRFSRVYKVSTDLESNSQGDFYNFHIEAAGFPSEAIYQKAEALYNAISSGERKMKMDVGGTGEAVEGEEQF
jgi:hypothetical protein